MFMAALFIGAVLVAHVVPLPTSLMFADPLSLSIVNQSLVINSGEQNNLTAVPNFVVEHCRDNTLDIYDRLYQSKRQARAAMFNAQAWGVDSEFGFGTMFKRNEARDAVTTILGHIYYSKGKPNLKPHPDTLSSPRFSCVTQESARIYNYLNLEYDPWYRCVSESRQAFYAESTSYIFLCPAFFAQPPMSERNHCPSVESNQFSGNPGIVYRDYQTYIALYHLIRFYLGYNALTDDTDPKEQLDWNECVGLNSVDSVLNPTNLQIYIALVSQQCTKWPNPFKPPFDPSGPLFSNSTSHRLSALVQIL